MVLRDVGRLPGGGKVPNLGVLDPESVKGVKNDCCLQFFFGVFTVCMLIFFFLWVFIINFVVLYSNPQCWIFCVCGGGGERQEAFVA